MDQFYLNIKETPATSVSRDYLQLLPAQATIQQQENETAMSLSEVTQPRCPTAWVTHLARSGNE